jgi:hypothetical protein
VVSEAAIWGAVGVGATGLTTVMRLLACLAALLITFPALAATDAQSEALWQRADALMTRNQYQQALPLLLEAAEHGHPRAQATLGNLYAGDTQGHSKHGIPYDMARAMYWYAKAAAQGHRYGEYGLANGYMLGLGGLPVDQVKASQLFESSAEKGLVDAQEAISMSYELGRGVPHDRAKAVAWARAAQQQGDYFAGAFAKILSNPNTPTFRNVDDMFGFVVGVFSYCWRGQFPRPLGRDPINPNYEIWLHVAPNWRDSYCR